MAKDYLEIGTDYIEEEKWYEAKKILTKAIAVLTVDQDIGAAFYNRSIANEETYHEENCIYDLKKAADYGILEALDILKEKKINYVPKRISSSEKDFDKGKAYYDDSDYINAFKYLEKSMNQGNIEACFYLGECYCYGKGTGKNEKMAFTLFEKAANQGHIDGLEKTGWCYHYGVGVMKDLDKALDWYTKAQNKGSKTAAKILSDYYR